MKKWLPVIIIAIVMAIAYFSGILDYLTFENLKQQRILLLDLVSEHPILMPVAFLVVYTIATALSLPVGALFTVLAGFLFPMPFCVIYVLFGATAGAACIFLAAKTAIGDMLKKKAGARLKKIEAGLQNNAVQFLLFVRLVVIFPFWLVNLAPAFFGIRLWTFVWTTFVGIIPGSFIYAQAGSGLGAIFDSGESFALDTIFNTKMKIALALLGVLALSPIVIKKLMRKKNVPH